MHACEIVQGINTAIFVWRGVERDGNELCWKWGYVGVEAREMRKCAHDGFFLSMKESALQVNGGWEREREYLIRMKCWK